MSSFLNMYYNEVKERPLLTREEECSLADEIQAGGPRAFPAWTKMVEGNLRLVIKLASSFKGRGMDDDDLISYGNFGLMDAAWRFKSEKGVKFNTYAKWWIERHIRQAIGEKGARAYVKVSLGMRQKAAKLERFIEEYINEYGGYPPNKVMVERTEFSEKQIRVILGVISMKKVPIEGSDNHWNDPTVESHYKSIEMRDSIKLMNLAMKDLPPRLQTVLSHRFAINGAPHKTLKELNVMFGVSSERVRQLEEDAKKELRNIYEEMESSNDPT